MKNVVSILIVSFLLAFPIHWYDQQALASIEKMLIDESQKAILIREYDDPFYVTVILSVIVVGFIVALYELLIFIAKRASSSSDEPNST